ncbi:cation transporter [Oceanibaculum pacificum]|uniref:Cation transporter n=1 Tax=Oceanibaculum pacificum TaxID=580166 RepID=A0A154VAE6_9PROT|nr:cation transporter [Oceanibaculum pacificum]KZC98282.1 cation transporter [Oceanibaculum pacificum]
MSARCGHSHNHASHGHASHAHAGGHSHEPAFDGASPAYRRILLLVLAINAAMFVIEVAAGAVAGSVSLYADSLDFAMDAATYGISFWAIGKAASVRARVAFAKGTSLGLLGAGVLGVAVWRAFSGAPPEPITMGAIGLLALAANVGSAVLLYRWREGDANVASVWQCSRNDAIGNVLVCVAALGVFGTGSAWPDLIVAGLMAALFLNSAIRILRQSLGELRAAEA